MMTGSGRSPRILLLTNNRIQPFTGGGVVLASLFHQVPADRMFILHSDPTETGRADYREYRLRDLRIEWPSLLRQVWRLVAAVLSAPVAVRKADLVNFVVQNCGYVVPKHVDAQI